MQRVSENLKIDELEFASRQLINITHLADGVLARSV